MSKDATNNSKAGSFLDKLIEKRLKLVEALDANKGEVNLDIFEDFYPDRAHFVYELLQNAEDAGATEVTFTLTREGLVCEHDGRRRFTEPDVASITGIHNSTKSEAQDQIGKFGVGFKSVFVYTQSPTVRSGDFAFRIVRLILPEPIATDRSIGSRTRFEFPFDNPKKPPPEAYAEIEAGLRELDETALLFLSNLQSIKWRAAERASGEVLRRTHTKSHVEVVKKSGGRTTSFSHYLKFDEGIPGLAAHRVAVAFPLDFLAGVREFDQKKPLSAQLRIVPANPGRVAVFFAAAKETSGLLFHLHGPFVPELSRASIKDSAANEPLFEQLAQLAARSLHEIKSLGLLTPDFLAVLPNPQDQIPARYQRIRKAIIAEMRSHDLTPTHAKGHAAANRLIQAKASLKELLSEEDIEFLVEYEDDPPLWAIGVTQKNSRIDNFLAGLAIKDWSSDNLVEALQRGTTTQTKWFRTSPHTVNEPDETFMAWLSAKPAEWMQQLYALLHDELGQQGSASQLRHLKIVRLGSGAFSIAAQSFFPSESTGERMPTVDAKSFTSGKSKPQQEKARKFLAELGVRELGEAEEIELILNARYTKEAEIPDDKTHRQDLKRFVALVERKPETKIMFAPYYIFQGEDEAWYTPATIYLDRPYRETDLAAYYARLGGEADHAALHARYKGCGIAAAKLGAFAETTGARVDLEIAQGFCHKNPEWSYLRSVGGDRHTSPIDRDYFVPKLRELLDTPDLDLSRLLWRTLTSFSRDSHFLQAAFRRNHSWGTHHADSRLIHDLRDANWVPQGAGVFVRPAEASSKLLPEGFPFDPGYAGLKAVKFGQEAAQQVERARQKDGVAKSLGFADADSLERAKRFAALPQAEQEKILTAQDRAAKAALPDRDLANPQRRAQKVAAQAMNAPDKESEMRSRSVSVGTEPVKEAADQYLRQHYRNADGEMTCQICKGPLPFKLDDGSEYFEIVECFPGLTKRHHQNYLALCPNHSAMYRFANGSADVMPEDFADLEGNELQVVLAQQDVTIYFSKIHIIDLRAVLDAESKLSQTSTDMTEISAASETSSDA
jgi:hypothetical protein